MDVGTPNPCEEGKNDASQKVASSNPVDSICAREYFLKTAQKIMLRNEKTNLGLNPRPLGWDNSHWAQIFAESAYWTRLEFLNIPWTDEFLTFGSPNFTAAKLQIERVVSSFSN